MSEHDNPLRALNASGQSVWYDNIQRSMLAAGELAALVERDDLRGVTSNPAIFEKAIGGSSDYDAAIAQALARRPQATPRELFTGLAIDDIRAAAEVLLPVYRRSGGVDGMVSLEVAPDLAHDTAATVREARELHARLDSPNVMIKVPATRAGVPAVEQLIAEGINVNVTLLFAVERYREVAEAWLRGLEQRLNRGQPVDRIASVASFFVSRVDAALDPQLAAAAPGLCGHIAIANARLAYRHFAELRAGARYAVLAAAGAQPQRLLWASTGTKNPAYSDVLYCEALIGPDTVNTMPPATYAAFRDHGVVARTLDTDLDAAAAALARLPALGIDLAAVTDRLEAEGVAAFATAFDSLLAAIAAKARAVTA
ncbi:transaldolase [Plasticicumulans lactativorans]|uniref:Transaldolase n=1 Tax=Plasticicumulans lactativorans TaxID=1133106 RepID=A0A4R2L782_9GAMM|nr:transaldolase [Plasticicumulans lactativorans]TCO82797.1 transaldolase [Plasticicumulans lactativorans]